MTRLPRADTLAGLMAPDPQFIEPMLLAEQEVSLNGQLELCSLPRLKNVLFDDAGAVTFRLEFGRDAEGVVYIVGEFGTDLELVCQRCLNPLTRHIQNAISIGIVTDRAEAERLPNRYEPLTLKDRHISLLMLIEDEILLGLPMAPVHEFACCSSGQFIADTAMRRENPFAVLKDLKLKKSTS